MILSDECYLRDVCKKYTRVDAECKYDNVYCPKLFRMDCLYNEALLSKKQRRKTALRVDEDGTDREAFIKLKQLAEGIEDFVSEGKNLYLHSKNCGNGKTEWSLRFIQSYIEKIWHKSDLKCRVLFINVPRYLLALKDTISGGTQETIDYVNHIRKNVMTADIVVFDEVATKALSAFDHENILSMINTRIDMEKSNIYTSNVSGEELRAKVGDRLYSRIVNMSINIELFGADKRGL